MKKETLNKFSDKIYSQFGEDGILKEILNRLDKKDHDKKKPVVKEEELDEEINEGEIPQGLKDYQDKQKAKGKSSKEDDEKDSESADSGKKPDFPDVDGDGDRKEPISKAQQDKKDMKESRMMKMIKSEILRQLKEMK